MTIRIHSGSVRIISVIALITLAAASAYAFRARLAVLPLLGRVFAPVTMAVPGSERQGQDVEHTHAASAPAADPPRDDITIDARRQQLIGVRVAPVEHATLSSEVTATGVVRYDETRQTDVNVRLEGWIRELYANFTGQPVRRGEPLFSVYSPELVATQNEFILALRSRDQAQASVVADAREYSSRLVDAARQRLTLWGLSAEQIRGIEDTRQPIETITIPAPVSGFVLEKQAIKGMRVSPGQTLYRIADISTVWVEADVYEQDISVVRIGQRATVTLDSYPGQTFAGRATYLYPSVDPQTRTMKVRAQFANPGGRLKPGMFAKVALRGAEHHGLTVPADAVLDSGTQQTVFVAEGDGRFTPRRVKVGRRFGNAVEILDGLSHGEQVATSATFFLDSESQLRAGLQNFEAPPAPADMTVAPAGPALDIQFQPLTNPPRTGDNTFEVRIAEAGGQPVTDADVLVQLFMPPMPAMNMPAYRSEAQLPHAGGGVYRGGAQVMMAGRWEVTVTVTRRGQRVGSRQFGLVAR